MLVSSMAVLGMCMAEEAGPSADELCGRTAEDLDADYNVTDIPEAFDWMAEITRWVDKEKFKNVSGLITRIFPRSVCV